MLLRRGMGLGYVVLPRPPRVSCGALGAPSDGAHPVSVTVKYTYTSSGLLPPPEMRPHSDSDLSKSRPEIVNRPGPLLLDTFHRNSKMAGGFPASPLFKQAEFGDFPSSRRQCCNRPPHRQLHLFPEQNGVRLRQHWGRSRSQNCIGVVYLALLGAEPIQRGVSASPVEVPLPMCVRIEIVGLQDAAKDLAHDPVLLHWAAKDRCGPCAPVGEIGTVYRAAIIRLGVRRHAPLLIDVALSKITIQNLCADGN